MLDPQDLTQVLSQVNTGGVQSTLLVNAEGSLVAFSGYGETDVNEKAAITSSIWSAYETNGAASLNDESTTCIIIDCKDGLVAMAKVSSLILCVFADRSVNVGMLQTKAMTLSQFLGEPLSRLAAA